MRHHVSDMSPPVRWLAALPVCRHLALAISGDGGLAVAMYLLITIVVALKPGSAGAAALVAAPGGEG